MVDRSTQGKDIPCPSVKELPTPANPEISHEPAGVCPASETRSFPLDIAQDRTQLSRDKDLTLGAYGILRALERELQAWLYF